MGADGTDKDATDYFRGIVKSGEKSERVLELTEAIIRLNPAHYSAWCALSLCSYLRSLYSGSRFFYQSYPFLRTLSTRVELSQLLQ